MQASKTCTQLKKQRTRKQWRANLRWMIYNTSYNGKSSPHEWHMLYLLYNHMYGNPNMPLQNNTILMQPKCTLGMVLCCARALSVCSTQIPYFNNLAGRTNQHASERCLDCDGCPQDTQHRACHNGMPTWCENLCCLHNNPCICCNNIKAGQGQPTLAVENDALITKSICGCNQATSTYFSLACAQN